MNKEFDITEAWGRSEQKLIRVRGTNFTELYEHLKDDKWIIEKISACSSGGDVPIYNSTFAYITLIRN